MRAQVGVEKDKAGPEIASTADEVLQPVFNAVTLVEILHIYDE